MSYEELTVEQWTEIEKKEHDLQYKDFFPFGLSRMDFSTEEALRYEDYSFKKGRREVSGQRTKKALQLIDLYDLSNRNVLDIGCGIGQYSVLFAKNDANVTGIELSSEGIKRARKIAKANGVYGKCKFIEGNFVEVDFLPEQFDVVWINAAYHHLIKYPNVKAKVMSCLKKGGKLVMADTVRGGSMVHFLREFVQKRRRKDEAVKKHERNLGDVLFSVDKYTEFAEGAFSFQVYQMSFFYMVNKVHLIKKNIDLPFVRLLLRLTKYLDDVALFVFPALRKYCGEAVLYLIK